MDMDNPREPQDMSVLANRLSLINRYNLSVGAPGPAAQQVQHDFIHDLMDLAKIATLVAEYELIIESRWPLRTTRGGA